MHPIMQFIGNLGYVVISILGGYMVIRDRIEVGDILSLHNMFVTLHNRLTSYLRS